MNIFYLLFLFFVPLMGFAGSSDNVSGWTWSENIGWISLNSTNTASPINYGVTINPGNGKFSGYAWSDNVGWLSFEKNDLTGCPSTPCEASLDFGTNQVTGWARFLAGDGSAQAGAWDGWVHFSGTASDGSSYGVIRSGSQLTGWAWGGDVIGWMEFSGSTFTTQLGSQVSQGGTITVEADNPDGTRYFGPLTVDIVGPTSLTTTNAPTTVGVDSGAYTLTYVSGGPNGVMASIDPGSSLQVNQGANDTVTFIFTDPPAPPSDPGGSGGPPTASQIVSDESFFCPSTQVNFTWFYSDPNGDPQDAFELEADDDSLFSSPELATGVVTSSDQSYINNPGDLFFNTTYYWRVRVRDIDGAWSDWSLVNSFVTPASCITADFSLISSNDIFVNIAKQIVNNNDAVIHAAQAQARLLPIAFGQGKENSTSATLTVVPTQFSDDVSLSVISGLPPGGQAFFTPSLLTSADYSTGSQFYVEVPKETTEGIYSLTVEGNGGGLVRSTTVLLSVIITDPRFKEF